MSLGARLHQGLTRNGVSPSCVFVSAELAAQCSTLFDFFVARFPRQTPAVWLERFAAQDVLNAQGQPVAADTRLDRVDCVTGKPAYIKQHLHYYRHVEAEPCIPFEAQVLYQDAHWVVADKPHFLPVTPSGRYVQETLLVRLKRQLGLPDLAPLHRIDRDTAGLVLFSVNAAERGQCQSIFRNSMVQKTYEAIAPYRADLALPLVRESRLEDSPIYMQMHEVPGPPNSRSEIELIETLPNKLARYRLKPITGKRHQLRVHMNALGLPLLNDGIYPTLTPEQHFLTAADYAKPLQLLAKFIGFTDPFGGAVREFDSLKTLMSA
jgi:tRNA pseudouridine32 synthase / 23S rRNA pseudouridine746 synthase